jgi:hypothetical protein
LSDFSSTHNNAVPGPYLLARLLGILSVQTAGQGECMFNIETKIQGSYLHCQPNGEINPSYSVHYLRQLMDECHRNGIRKLLIDVSSLSSVKVSDSHQFLLATQVSDFWDRSIKVAVVCQGPDTSLYKFGLLVFTNRGITIDVFTSEDRAAIWLMGNSRLYAPARPLMAELMPVH